MAGFSSFQSCHFHDKAETRYLHSLDGIRYQYRAPSVSVHTAVGVNALVKIDLRLQFIKSSIDQPLYFSVEFRLMNLYRALDEFMFL